MKIYFFPGLGFDKRIFSNLILDELNVEFLDWMEPEKDMNFNGYAKEQVSEIDWNSECVILIGHSLGGLLCQEIATIKPVKKIILISSIKSRDELPFHFKIVQPLRLHKLLTKSTTFKTLSFWAKRHDYESQEEQDLFKSMVGQHSNNYLQWALKELSIWQPPLLPSQTIIAQIHGKEDMTFPVKLINQPDYVIDNAGHFMVYKKPNEISEIIRKELSIV